MAAPNTSPLTIVLNHPEAEAFARLLKDSFPNVRAIVAPDTQRLERHLEEADVLLAFRFPIEAIGKARRLRWFQCTGAGVDSILPVRDLVGHLTVTNGRGVHGEVIADYVMAGVTMLHWDFRGFLRDQAAMRWTPRSVPPLADKAIGVVGLGAIGATIARRAKSAGMRVFGMKRDASAPVEGVDRIFTPKELHELLPRCDFIVLAVPATEQTIGLIGSAELRAMRADAFLINIARGNVVVETDLVEALQKGVIAGAMLDVFEHEPLPQDSPLWGMPQVIATPHVAGNPTNYVERVFAIFSENIERFMSGEPLINVVDLNRGY